MVILWLILLFGFNMALIGSYLDGKTSHKGMIITHEPYPMLIFVSTFAFILIFFQKWLKEKRKTNYYKVMYKGLCEDEITYNKMFSVSKTPDYIIKEKKRLERYLKMIELQKKIKKNTNGNRNNF